MDRPIDQLQTLARILNMRKHLSKRPYNLLLTSSLSLTSDVYKAICGTDDWSSFRIFLQQLSSSDRLNILTAVLDPSRQQTGYRALARLITKGYFSLIFTTNIDSDLDQALFEEKVFVQHMLIVGRNTNEHIVQIVDENITNPRILKLQGSLREGALADQFPDFFELPTEISRSVRHHLNQDTLIVGSLEHQHGLEQVMSRESKGSIYAVPFHEIPREDALYQIIRGRGHNPEQRIFSDQGNFDIFFTNLEALLMNNVQGEMQKSKEVQYALNHPVSTLSPVHPQLAPAQPSQKAQVFIDYSKGDRRFLNELHIYLNQYIKAETVNYWDDTKIPPGAQEQKEIDLALQQTKVAVLLVSPEFLSIDSSTQRRLASLLPATEQNDIRILCVIIRTCAFEESPLAQFRPVNTKPLSGMNLSKREEVWDKVARLVRDSL